MVFYCHFFPNPISWVWIREKISYRADPKIILVAFSGPTSKHPKMVFSEIYKNYIYYNSMTAIEIFSQCCRY